MIGHQLPDKYGDSTFTPWICTVRRSVLQNAAHLAFAVICWLVTAHATAIHPLGAGHGQGHGGLNARLNLSVPTMSPAIPHQEHLR